MTTTQARARIAYLLDSGYITADEAAYRHRAITEINSGYRYGSRISRAQQARLRAAWAAK
jgi:hypothetical protein